LFDHTQVTLCKR